MFNTSRIIIIISKLLLSIVIAHAQDKTLSKELTISKPFTTGSKVIIDQLDRKIIIKASADNTIKVVTTVFYRGQNSVTDAEWWDYLNLEVKELTGLVSIQPIRIYGNREGAKKRDVPDQRADYELKDPAGPGIADFDSAGQWKNRKANIRRDVIIYIPSSAHVQLENRYGDIVIQTNLEELNAVVDHVSLTMPDAAKLVLRSSYGHITTGNIKDASIEMTGGKWSGKKIDKLTIASKSSSIDLASVQDATINSGDDQYDIDEAMSIHGTKNFGDLRILQLIGSLDVKGNSANVKVRSLKESVTLIKIDGQFADLKFPLASLKNYSIAFQGSTSKVYAPFALPENKTEFNTSAGNVTGAHTSLQLKCPNCTVEF